MFLTIEQRNNLIMSHIALAEKIAYSKKRRVPSCVDVDELKSAAYFGLVDAASRFNPKYKSFAGYAAIRITGSIYDSLRKLGWGSRCQYTVIFGNDDSPLESWIADESNDDFELFYEIIKNLNDIEKKIFFWYYGDNYNMREIGEKLNVSESRVSQIIKDCKSRLRKQWEKEDFL